MIYIPDPPDWFIHDPYQNPMSPPPDNLADKETRYWLWVRYYTDQMRLITPELFGGYPPAAPPNPPGTWSTQVPGHPDVTATGMMDTFLSDPSPVTPSEPTRQYYRLKLSDNDSFSNPPYLTDGDKNEITPSIFEERLWYKAENENYWWPEPKFKNIAFPFLFAPSSTLTPYTPES